MPVNVKDDGSFEIIYGCGIMRECLTNKNIIKSGTRETGIKYLQETKHEMQPILDLKRALEERLKNTETRILG